MNACNRFFKNVPLSLLLFIWISAVAALAAALVYLDSKAM